MGPCWHYAWQTVTNLKHSQNEEVSAMEMQSGYKLAQERVGWEARLCRSQTNDKNMSVKQILFLGHCEKKNLRPESLFSL